tara:strand:- start:45588 stop:46262 length:675 start_codon:yes stop_codon:yes gene_type:complete
MAKILEREKARALRRDGRSIGEISEKVGVSKSTASYWCRDIPLSEAQIEKLSNQQKKASVQALLRSAEKRRADRLKQVQHYAKCGQDDVGAITKRDLFITGLALYWGEGYKKGNDEFGFTNSEPKVIKLIIKWLTEIYGVKSENLIFRVSINQDHKTRIRDVEQRWSEIVSTPLEQFTKPSFIKARSKKKYPNAHTHIGTLRVKVRRGANLRRQVLGSIEALSQ